MEQLPWARHITWDICMKDTDINITRFCLFWSGMLGIHVGDVGESKEDVKTNDNMVRERLIQITRGIKVGGGLSGK